MGIYIIALESRKEYAISTLKEFGLRESTTVVDAVNRDAFEIADLVKAGKLREGFEPALKNWEFRRKGIVACALSHQKAMKMFLKDKTLTHAVIFEDDIILQEGIRGRIARVQGKDPENISILKYLHDLAKSSNQEPTWDGLNLGICSKECGDTAKVLPGRIKLIQSSQPYCTHAYIYTRHAAEVELEANIPIHRSEDRIRVDLMESGTFTYLSTVPRIFDQNPEDDATGEKSIHKKSTLDMPICH
eukprot:jgi/Bigna1/139557/aug1.51_g14265